MLRFACLLVLAAGVIAEVPQDNDNEYAFMVSIRMNNKHICSGIIIDKYHILTSNRCVPSFQHAWNVMNDMTVVTGSNSINGAGSIFVKETFSQNHYVNPTRNPVISGVGMLRLVRPLDFNEKMQPIELFDGKVPQDAEVQMVGWGIVSADNKTIDLAKVSLQIIDKETCQSFFKKTLLKHEFCTGPVLENGPCQGDKGNPIIYNGKLVGVTTFGTSCKAKFVPDVHIDADNMREYIRSVLVY